MRRLAAFAAGVVVAGGMALFAAPTANAHPPLYPCYSGGMNSATFAVQYVGANSTWVGYLDTARAAWNSSSGFSGYISSATPSSNTIEVGTYAYSDLGRYYPLGSGSSRHFRIEVNTWTLASSSTPATFAAWSKGTSTHELGHALRLSDDPAPSFPDSSLMNHARDHGHIISPTLYDTVYEGVCMP